MTNPAEDMSLLLDDIEELMDIYDLSNLTQTIQPDVLDLTSQDTLNLHAFPLSPQPSDINTPQFSVANLPPLPEPIINPDNFAMILSPPSPFKDPHNISTITNHDPRKRYLNENCIHDITEPPRKRLKPNHTPDNTYA